MHPDRGAVTRNVAKQAAGWQPAVATMIMTRPNRAAVTAKQDAGWRPAATIMIIMQGAVTGKRGAGWQPAAAMMIIMRPNRGAVTGHVAGLAARSGHNDH